MARFTAFIEGSTDDESQEGGTRVHARLQRRASEITIGVNGKRAGIEVEATVEEADDTDLFRLYATRGNLAASRLFLGSVRLERGIVTFHAAPQWWAKEEA